MPVGAVRTFAVTASYFDARVNSYLKTLTAVAHARASL
ncbi:protein of unknown function [Candidatus Filomicrobium marinum]|uniref:Uncharacterized protein n=1 Tax=Candidatus Filomicrobium marinum TaxID=1608628 RepID=A0A0D6JKW8_9HYPH|nr:protein of unknown function [Candidatus Filomicrobium marinum]CPR22608.1 protein of unknown function [Candidatus Filomicrobium marinum]